MTCREFTDFIVDYLSGELAPEASGPFEQHLLRCTNCRQYLAQYQEAIRLGRAAFGDPDATVPEDVPDELVQAILNARRS